MRFLHLIILLILIPSVCPAIESTKRRNSDSVATKGRQDTSISVVSIIPAQGYPGSKVVISGGGFSGGVSVTLGNIEISATKNSEQQIEFMIPQQTAAGLYVLLLKRSDGVQGRSYNFTVLPSRPSLMSLKPSEISSCASGSEREILALGSEFDASSLLYFDGAALASTFISSGAIGFKVPQVQGGLHQIQIKNPNDTSSSLLNLVIDSKPVINDVSIGSEHVNMYEIIISGKNFTHNSYITVDGNQIGGNGSREIGEREKLIYIDCTKLIYQRHPYSPVTKDLKVQVINPGGESSQVVTVSAP